ncbi:MAG: YdcF family protein [Spirochaetaceae bacterium]|jgi:uncharacterized SAM-binding protein YcdF (DUF218 family)|nr:YdcF family protein [Spirochaetaceae bacterium]
MRDKSVQYIGICVAVLILYHIVYVTVTIYAIGTRNDAHTADAAVILGAAAWNNRPSPVFRERINHGIWLYKQGYVRKLIFTGGKSLNAPFSESEVARNYATANLIPPEDIYIEEYSRTTYENILYAAYIIKEHGFKTVLLVSDPLHLKRAMAIAEDNHITAYTSPTPTTLYKSPKTILPFLVREVFYYILYEIEKYYMRINLYAVILCTAAFAGNRYIRYKEFLCQRKYWFS